ncbi:hypothetical protein KR032_012268 [Drosophila birchii]|nr:hypothetical protein KR032_012268 [Drosophila birchii]
MMYSILMPLMVFILCGGAWATREPKRLANESLVEATAAVTNSSEISKLHFRREGVTMDTGMRLTFNQKLREALTAVHCAFKYMAAKLKRRIDRFEKNMEVVRDLKRRRQEALDVAMRAKQRRFRKLKAAPPLQLSRQIRPLPVRLLTKPPGPKKIIVAAI